MSLPSDMDVFVQVMDSGGFTAAAEQLGVTPSAVSKLVTRLEKRLGVRLIHRTTRRISLTSEGEAYLLRAKDILTQIQETELEVSRGAVEPQGRLRVTCVAPFAHFYLSQVLPEFLAKYPKVEVELAASDRIVDLLDQNSDLGIRTGEVTDPSLVVRKICEVEWGLFASPGYLARNGTPRLPDQLTQHACIRLNSYALSQQWPFIVNGRAKTIDIGNRLAVDDAIVMLQLALAGCGIIRSTNMTAWQAVRSGQLIKLLPECHVPQPRPLSAVYPSGRQRMLKVRVFIDFLLEKFGRPPWL